MLHCPSSQSLRTVHSRKLSSRKHRTERAQLRSYHQTFAASDQSGALGSSPSDGLKEQLLTATAGLDRGLDLSQQQTAQVRRAAAELEALGKHVLLSWVAAGSVRCGMDLFDGVWRLVYTSAFEGGNLGGTRPGPQASLAPVSLGAIFQSVQVDKSTLDNIVELQFKTPPLPFKFEAPTLRACLKHTFTVSDDNNVRILYDSTSVTPLKDSQPLELFGSPVSLNPPALQRLLPEDIRSATFRVTYLDEDMRVTRGDRGELRVYVRDPGALGTAPTAPDPETDTTFVSQQ